MNEIFINDEIGMWGITSKSIIEQLKNMNGDVTVYVDSPGGSVFEGIAIFNAFKSYDKGNVDFIIISLAASIASYIPLSGRSVKAYDNATYMIHNAWTYTYGDHNEMRKVANVLEGLSSLILKKYVEKTGKKEDEIKALMDSESYFFGNEILEFGFCDEIISTETDKSKNESLALANETFKACKKNISDNFTSDEFVQAVAKLTKDGLLSSEDVEVVETVATLDDTQQKQRERELQILQREIQI